MSACSMTGDVEMTRIKYLLALIYLTLNEYFHLDSSLSLNLKSLKIVPFQYTEPHSSKVKCYAKERCLRENKQADCRATDQQIQGPRPYLRIVQN